MTTAHHWALHQDDRPFYYACWRHVDGTETWRLEMCWHPYGPFTLSEYEGIMWGVWAKWVEPGRDL